MSAQAEVRDYYDTNTARFEKFGQGGDSIHRAVWAEGVSTRAEAFRYLDQLIASEVTALAGAFQAPLHVLDLGCGLGASLFFLASQHAIVGTGATLSGVQARVAAQRSASLGLADRVQFLEADFLGLPAEVPPAALAFSIEAFIHGPDPAAYFRAAARYVAPGGRLVLCDDFLGARAGTASSRRERRWLREVRSGWLANSLVTVGAAQEMAANAGFRLLENRDLTSALELRRPRDRALSLLLALGRHLPIGGYRWRSWVGGNALQLALVNRLLEFRYVVFERLDAPASEAAPGA
jgi:cyclopropane fatty-acyl-phospholipid synthase-like methyltransferase